MELITRAKTRKISFLILRVLALGATLIATIIMATSHEKSNLFSISIEAKYSHTPAFKYFVIVNIIGSVYSFLAIFVPAKSSLRRILIALDAVITILLTSGLSSALAIAYVGKKGNSHAGWLPICGQVKNYCYHVGGALAAGFGGVIIYMLLLLSTILCFSLLNCAL